MRFEHLALNVSEPVAQAAWYCQHLGLRAVVANDTPPYGHFLADDSGAMMIELYYNPDAPCPDYAQRHHLEFHLALACSDTKAEVERLCNVGCTVVEWVLPEDGSCIAMLRDPWGVPLQLCQRAKNMHLPVI